MSITPASWIGSSTIPTPQLPFNQGVYSSARLPNLSSESTAGWQGVAASANSGIHPGIQVVAPEIAQALSVLANTYNDPADEAYLENLGITILYHNGQEAINTLNQNGVTIEFGSTGDPKAHAVWMQKDRKILINKQYRGNTDPQVLKAIAAAIYHEAGHAGGLGDNDSSIQEELNCLALNTLAYRAHLKSDPSYAYATQVGALKPLFEDGVALYAQLFFDNDPFKRGLVNRVIEKYGTLPPDTPDHPIPTLAYSKTLTERVLHETQRRYARQLALGI